MELGKKDVQKTIAGGKTVLGIEFGSTRIKAVLIGPDHLPIASGTHDWENRFENDIWTYSLEDIRTGLQGAFSNLTSKIHEIYGMKLNQLGAMGISGMMHGYLALDKDDNLLVPFRTWRNTMTEKAAHDLSELLHFNIPQRWSIAHLYQAILNKEPHVRDIHTLTTLSGYIHWKLTGQKVMGIGEASGMFPIDSQRHDFDGRMVDKFNAHIGSEKLPWTLQDILPKVLIAGDSAGILTGDGAKLLDPSRQLLPGTPFSPPEGDAGTGMVATNSVAERTGNVSAGTSVFAMIVMEKPLSKVYPEIDMVTTPTGYPVAMVHCNNCTTDLNAWIGLFQEFTCTLGVEVDQSRLFELLYQKALEGEMDCGNLLAYNYYSGEPITHLDEGRPLFVRTPNSHFTLANFMRTHLFSALGTLKIGMDILFDQEKVKLHQLIGHGGFFKTPVVGQKMMAATVNVPVSVMDTAGEGGAWGIALLASYMLQRSANETFEDYLSVKVFAGKRIATINPDQQDVESLRIFMERFQKGLNIEKAAVDAFE